MADPPHVVILGVGFAGLGAARRLKDAPVRITLIDQHDYHTFQPLLYQVATHELDASEVGFPIRELLHRQDNTDFHQARVTGLDLPARQVQLDGMAPLGYDYLVLGLGAVANFFGTPGAAEHGFPMYTMADALRLKHHILRLLESVDREPARVEDGALTFAVVGGGPTGVEVSGALTEFLHAVAEKDYPNLPIRDRAQVLLFEAGATLLAPFDKKLQTYAKRALEERGVTVRLGEGVSAIEPTRIILRSGEVVKAHTLVWGAGIQAHPLAASLGVAQARGGRVPVGPDLALPDHPEVFVVGDMAVITDGKTGQPLAQLGSVAQQAGRAAAENIRRHLEGQPPEPFEYLDKGTMATIGRGAAVVQLPRHGTMTGHAAWLAWMGVHLALLSGGEEKTATLVDWGWTLTTHKRGKRIVVSDEDLAAHAETPVETPVDAPTGPAA
jgi:NADH dehydrogenase